MSSPEAPSALRPGVGGWLRAGAGALAAALLVAAVVVGGVHLLSRPAIPPLVVVSGTVSTPHPAVSAAGCRAQPQPAFTDPTDIFQFTMQAARQHGCWSYRDASVPSGQVFDILTQYLNTGQAQQRDVDVQVVLPPPLSLVPGSSTLYNAAHPAGQPVAADTIATPAGIHIGAYGGHSNAYVSFLVRSPAAGQLPCGSTRYFVTGSVWPQVPSGIHEYEPAVTSVDVAKPCHP